MQPIPLSIVAAQRDVHGSACFIVRTLGELHGVASTGLLAMSASAFGARRGLQTPDIPVLACDKKLQPIRGEVWFMQEREGQEVHQFWFVSDYLAERLAQAGELVLLVCDERYVWGRYGSGPMEDDLAFLDEPATPEIDDPTEDDHARMIEHRRSDP